MNLLEPKSLSISKQTLAIGNENGFHSTRNTTREDAEHGDQSDKTELELIKGSDENFQPIHKPWSEESMAFKRDFDDPNISHEELKKKYPNRV